MKRIFTSLIVKKLFFILLIAGAAQAVNAQNTLDGLGLSSSTHALAAYSLRKLSSTYTGNAIRVTRSSDNATQDIGFTPSGGLDVTALTAFVGSNTGYISIWYDQSGGGNNVIPFAGGTGPVIVNSGVLNTSNNNLPCALFSGSVSSLKGLATYSPTTPFTLNTVAPASFGTIVALSGTNGGDQNSVLGAGEGGPSNAAWFGGYEEDGGFSAGTATTAESIRTKTYSSNKITGYFNSANIFSATVTYNLNGGDILLGVQTDSNNFEFLSGSSSEITVFASSLSSADQSTLEANQANYYGITQSLSSDATLASLSTSPGTLSPAFSAGVTGYAESAIGLTSLTVTAAPNNINAKVTINGVAETSGTVTLSPGTTTVNVVVTAQNGTVKTYTISINNQVSNILDKAGLGSGAPAIAAYSLRRLSTTYAGNAIRVTRSSDNATQDIGFTASGGLDVTALTTFVGSNTGYISVWYDQSGNGNDVKPFSFGGTGPVIVNAGTVNMNNNLPCANFFAQSTILRSTASFSAATPFTMNSVAAAQGGTIVTLSGADAGDQNSCLGAGRLEVPGVAWFGGYLEDNTFVVGTSTSAQTVRTKSYTPGAITGYVNSKDVFSANITYNLSDGDILLGTQEDVNHFEILNGSSSEVTVFTSTLSNTDRQALENNQSTYYGVSFPTTLTSISASGSTFINSASVNYTVTFANPVSGLTAGNFTITAPALTGASVGTPVSTDGGFTWTVPVNTGTGDGTLTLNLDNAAGIANTINTTLPFAGSTLTVDKTPPVINIGNPSVTAINAGAGTVTYAITYTDANFTSSTLSPQSVTLNTTGSAAGTIAVSNSGVTGTVTISDITGSGTIGISIAAGAVSDQAGNLSAAAGPSQIFNVTAAKNTLDKLGLTSALPSAGAYSLRLLSSTYTGPLARITVGGNYYDVYPDASGSQAFSLSSPVSAAYTSYNAARTAATAGTLSSVIAGGTATVAIWYDQDGSGNDAIQANTNIQPEIINAGAIDVTNNLPSIKFSGSAWLVVTSADFNTDLSGSVVFNATNTNNSGGGANTWYIMNGIFGSEQPGGVNDFGYGIYNNKFTAGNGPSDSSVGGNTSVNDGVFRINSWTRDNTSGNIALYASGLADGTAVLNGGTRTAVPSVAIGAITTGGGGNYNGALSEMTVFPSVYTDAQRQTIENNQFAYYGITSPQADARLSGLTISQGTLSPVFASGVTSYTASLGANVPTLIVTATPDNSNAVVTINNIGETSGVIAISASTTTVNIAVTSQDGTATKTYTLTLTAQTPNILDKAGLGSSTPALAAYSLRRLSTTYTGNAIQVTRSSDNATQDIGFTAPGGLDVTALTAFVGANDGYISVWYDQSGNGNDEKPFSFGGTGPVIVNAGTVNMNNNLPCANFFAQTTILRSTASFSAATPFTMNSVAAAQGGTIVTLSGADGGDQNSCLGAGRNAIPGAAWFGGWFEDGAFVVGTSTSAQTVRTKSYSPGAITGYVNSQDVFSANITYNLSDGDILLGTQEDVNHFEILTGSSSEITVFTSTLSNTDRQALENNQGVYYGVPFPTTVTAINTNGSASTNAASVNYTVIFANQVTGLTAGNFTLTAPALTGASVGTPVTNDGGLTWTVPVNTGTGDGTLILNLDNTAGIANAISAALPFAGAVYTIDKTAPAVSIGSPSVSSIPASTGSVTYTVTYSDANFNASTLSTQDVTLNTTGNATGTFTVANSGTTSTVTIADIAGIGTIGISIASGTATDLNGNVAGAAGPSATFAVTVAPAALDKLGLNSSLPSAGAYSLRLLSSVYTGPLVRITIGSNYYDVYPDASASKAFSLSSPVSASYASYNAGGTGATTNPLSSVITGNTATVAIWYDQSGKGDDAAQANPGAQPEIINAGSIDVTNNLPTLKFSGSTWLVITATAFNTDLSGSVVFDATNPNNSSGGPGAWFAMNGIFGSEQPGAAFDFAYGIFNNKFTAGNGPSDNSIGGNTVVNNNIFRVSSWTRDNSTGNVALYAGGVADGTATLNTGARTAVPSVAIGATTTSGSGGFTGTISEMTIFPAVYTDVQRQTVEGNQVAYYGLPSLLADAGLASLSVDQGTISPAFSTAVTTYTESLGSSATSLTVTAIPDNPGAAVTINNQTETSGAIALHAGTNVVTVAVKSQDGTMTNTYTLTVYVQAPHFLDKAGLGSGTPALGAYSLRQMSTTYTGKAIQVLRSNDNAVQDIGFTASGGLDVTALMAFVGSNTGYIVTWYDQSGQANDAQVATNIFGATGPVIVNAGTLNISNNKLPCAIFSSAASALIAPAAFSPTTPFSMNGVSAATTGAIVTLSGTTNTAQNSTLGVSQQNGGFAGWFGGWAEDLANFSVGTYTSGQIVRTKTYAANIITGFINSQDVFSANVTYNLNDPHIIIGVQSKGFDQALMGSASEITVFTSSLNNTDRQALENNQSVYYGALSFPTTVTAISTNGSTLTNAASVNYTVTFANPVSGLTAGNFTVTAPALTGANVGTPVSTDGGLTWTVPVNTGTGDGTLTLSLDNATGIANTINNTLPFAGDTYTIDKTPPTAVISAPSAATIDAGTSGMVTYTVTYADANFNTSNLGNSGITLNTTNTATGTFNVTGSGTSYTATISNITGAGTLGISVAAGYASDNAGNTDAGAGASATFNVLSSNAALAGMGPQYGPLSPVFSPGNTSYTLNVSNTAKTMWVKPVAADAGATIIVNGTPVTSGSQSVPVTLTEGVSAAISVVVTAQDGIATKTYTINVTRGPSGNANLAGIGSSITPLTPIFSAGTTSYSLSVGNATKTMTVSPVAADPNSTITVNGNPVTSGGLSQAVPLTEGTTTAINVVVKAQNGATKTYTITVTRALPGNANLASIGTSTPPLAPFFVPQTTSYTVSVTNATKTMTLTPVAADPLATITVNTATVASGATSDPITLTAAATTTVTVVVTAQDGTTKTYTINVTRAGSANNLLASMGPSISPMTPVFSPVKNSYTLSVPNTTQTMTVTPVAEDANAAITVNTATVASKSTSDPVALTAGATIPINVTVTAQNGATNTYTIQVTRAPGSTDSFNPGISVTKPTETVTLAEDGIIVHQGISPNGDGVNDFLQIDNISQYPENNLKIMNRNGQLVYEAKGYDNSSRTFDGHSNKNGQMQLPGTYFYQLDYTVNGIAKHKTGFIVLKY